MITSGGEKPPGVRALARVLAGRREDYMEKELRKISRRMLQMILKEHDLWVRYDGNPKSNDRANLSGADLHGADLRKVNLAYASLNHADLKKADLSKAYLRQADLSGTDLFGANLIDANLKAVNLGKADLRLADLSLADLRWADLHEADLREADLDGANLSGADLRGAKLWGTSLKWARLARTRVSKREDLAGALIDGYEGFVFDEEDEEKVKEDRAQRDDTADRAFGTRADGIISFNLPDSYGPAQVGQVLILITFLYEGVRLAMTAPFDSIDNLFNKAMRPELYGAYGDRNALRIGQLTKGSVFGEAVGKGGLTEFIIQLCTIRQGIRTRKAQLQAEEAKAKLEIAKTEMAAWEMTNHPTPGAETPALAAPMDCSTPRLLASPEEKKALEMTVKATFGELDHQPERTEAALKVVDQATNSLSLLQQRLGGEFKIDGKNIPLDPPDDDGESGAPLQA
ncbi:MAG: pentapeptide repeat-containing protein [Desulfarculus sp.]|nr:pentapeptide repeat-containing protein [Desulfarculus sp.]